MPNCMIQQLKWDEKTNQCMVVTKFPDGSIFAEPATPEQAAQWQAENKY